MVEINWNKVLGAVLGGHTGSIIDGDSLKMEPKPREDGSKKTDLLGAVHKISSVAMDQGLHDAIKSVKVSIFGDGKTDAEVSPVSGVSSNEIRQTLRHSLKELPPRYIVDKGISGEACGYDNGRLVLWVLIGTSKENFTMRIGDDFVDVEAKALTYNPDNIKEDGNTLVGDPFQAASISIKLPCKVIKTPVSTSYINGVACVVLNRLEPAKPVDDRIVFD